MKFLLAGILLLTGSFVFAQPFNITPKPVSLKSGTGFFTMPQRLQIIWDKGSKDAAQFLGNYLNRYYKVRSVLTEAGSSQKRPNAVSLKSTPGEKGAYTLKVDKAAITISGDEAGTFYGVQTLIQLLPVTQSETPIPNPQFQIPVVDINDYPRFAYRGMHLDVSRHFFPVDFVKRYIDYLALHKFNYFHWHLTDDQGWRIEIKKYPKLTQTGAYRNGTIIGRYPGTGNDNEAYGGFYTQEEVKDIVQYAAQRHITVMPEIEMPGHASAAIASYPWLSCFPNEKTVIPGKFISDKSKGATGKLLQETWGVFDDVFCAGKDSTFTFLQDVLDEVLPLFPSKIIHVGGDECPKTSWKRCPQCQQRMRENNLKDEHQLQSYFIQRMEKYLNSKGRTLMGWDEILEGGFAPNAMVMSWRGEEGGITAAKQHHNVVMTPGAYMYFDHTQSEREDSVTIGGFTPLEKVYGYEPVPAVLNADEAKYIMGAQANLWAEYIAYPSKVEYMIFPRMTALSEVLWSPKESRDWKDFEKRIPTIFSRYHLWYANYSTAYYNLTTSVNPAKNGNGIVWKVTSKNNCEYCKVEAFQEFTRKTDTTVYDTTGIVDEKTLKITKYKVTPYLKQAATKDTNYYQNPNEVEVLINESSNVKARQRYDVMAGPYIEQGFSFNKATGKKVTLTTPASKNYPGNGAFTLVDGIQNKKGLNASKEFLGFNGKDLEAVIDLGSVQPVNLISLHLFQQPGSWIYLPTEVEYFRSDDGQDFKSIGKGNMAITREETPVNMIYLKEAGVQSRYIKVLARNTTKIAEDKPGAGNPAWLFADEIEVM